MANELLCLKKKKKVLAGNIWDMCGPGCVHLKGCLGIACLPSFYPLPVKMGSVFNYGDDKKRAGGRLWRSSEHQRKMVLEIRDHQQAHQMLSSAFNRLLCSRLGYRKPDRA